MKRYDFFISLLLGLAMGTGYMTSLRFIGPIGISEIIFLVVFLLLIIRRHKYLYVLPNNIEGWSKLYLLVSFLVILPFVSFAVYMFGGLPGTALEYCVSFVMSILLMFLLVESIRREQLNVGVIVICFTASFLLSNFWYILTNPIMEAARFTSYSNNPNQPLFYLTSLMLLLSIHSSKLLVITLLPIGFLGYISGSDAFNLMILVALFVLVYLKLFYSERLSLGANFALHTLLVLVVLSPFLSTILSSVVQLWISADEGGSRLGLFRNAFLVSAQSPIFGWGVGSFSDPFSPFGISEAHNNFLDLSMQFGFIVPTILYLVILTSIFVFIRQRRFLAAAFTLAFLISGLFHFSARHFIFWVEMAILWTIVFKPKIEYKSSHQVSETPLLASIKSNF